MQIFSIRCLTKKFAVRRKEVLNLLRTTLNCEPRTKDFKLLSKLMSSGFHRSIEHDFRQLHSEFFQFFESGFKLVHFVAAIENHGDPMPGVFITLEKLEGGKEGLASQVMTDAQGNFEFKNIAPGKYIVTVGKKHIGGVKYEDMKFTVVSPRDSASGLPTGKR